MSSRKRRLNLQGMEIESSILQKFGDIEIMKEKKLESPVSQVRVMVTDTTSMRVSRIFCLLNCVWVYMSIVVV